MKAIDNCVIITGMSGAGKSTALRILEDEGFFACDNLPPSAIPCVLNAVDRSSAAETGVAIVIDIRCQELLDDLLAALADVKALTSKVTIIFLDASDSLLVRRFETTRRKHPLGPSSTILECIAREREMLKGIKLKSDIIKDTSSMLPSDLRRELLSELGMNDDPLSVIISSFGFKYGIPKDCDYMFDVRFLPNPNYVPKLKKLTGCDREVREYLDKVPSMESFISLADEMTDFISMQYMHTGKKQVHIAFGCTGGRHRSVASAEIICDHLRVKGHSVSLTHRDIHMEDE